MMEIQHGVPIPHTRKYPFHKLAVGDSCDFPVEEGRAAQAAASRYKRAVERSTGTAWNYISRVVWDDYWGGHVCRLWRVQALGGRSVWHFDLLNVGEYFHINPRKVKAARQAAVRWRDSHPGWDFQVEEVDGILSVRRTK
jgi:hypothetical protein